MSEEQAIFATKPQLAAHGPPMGMALQMQELRERDTYCIALVERRVSQPPSLSFGISFISAISERGEYNRPDVLSMRRKTAEKERRWLRSYKS